MIRENKTAYPLQWPVGYARSNQRIRSNFKQTSDKAQRFLRDEVQRLAGRYKDPDLIVSTNLRVRADGGIYSSDMDKRLPDPGVAIYFKYKGKEISMCCDQYVTVWENIYALGCGIKALRDLERWGVSDFLDRAFTGFAALPPAQEKSFREWWIILGYVSTPSNFESIKMRYREMSKKYHPDNVETGSVEMFQELNNAFFDAKRHFGLI